jgi:hypothetical protein
MTVMFLMPCVQSLKALCLVSIEHYTESGNYLASDEEKGRRVLWGRVSYLNKRETHIMRVRHLSQ